jgi:hypothetical protein
MANNINISGIKKTTTITDGDYVLIESPTLGTRLIKKKHLFSNLSDLGIKSLSSMHDTIQISPLADYNNIEVRTTTSLGSGVTLPPTAGSVYTYTENRLSSLSGSVNSNISSLRSLYNGTHLTLSGIAKIPTLTGDTYLSGGTLRVSKGNGHIQRWQSSDGVDVASLNAEGAFSCFNVVINNWLGLYEDNIVSILGGDGLLLTNLFGDVVKLGNSLNVNTQFYGNVSSPNISALSANLLSLSSASLNNNTTRVYGSGTAACPVTILVATGEANKTYHISGKFITSNSGGGCFTFDTLASTNGSGNFTILHGSNASRDHPVGGTLSLEVLDSANLLELYYDGGGTDKYTYFANIIKV